MRLLDQCGTPLVVRHGDCTAVLESLAAECSAAACHVIEDDVLGRARAAQRTACSALAKPAASGGLSDDRRSFLASCRKAHKTLPLIF